jgi:hypothetical protein
LAGGNVERGKGRAHVRNVSTASISENPKHKGKSVDAEDGQRAGGQLESRPQQGLEPLVVLACRHIYHQSCLEAMQIDGQAAGDLSDGREFRCPIDG